jgi:DNA topoisomerase IB
MFTQVGNFRVEPPGLFRGRGEHPKMGRIKRRIYPKDIVINIGKGVPIPKHPYPGQHWKMVRQLSSVCTPIGLSHAQMHSATRQKVDFSRHHY